jgi:adenylosuccinate synthase
VKTIIAISGPICSGKTTLAQNIDHDATVLKTRNLIELEHQAQGESIFGRVDLQRLGDELDRKGGSWIIPYISEALHYNDHVIVDSVRIFGQIDAIRMSSMFSDCKILHVHLTASDELLRHRFNERGDRESYHEVKANTTEAHIEELQANADLVVDTGRCTTVDVKFMVMSRLRLNLNRDERLVDALVGAQYGSEGKGHVVSYLAPEYDCFVRVGGPNAGHTVLHHTIGKHSFYHLPSGTLHNPKAQLVLGPGSNINQLVLQREIDACDVTPLRLAIDPNANIITEEDIERESNVVKSIGSTGQGVGEATAGKILGRRDTRKLAKHVEWMRPFLRPTLEVLDLMYSQGKRIFLEGTQGTGLSLYHGPYPHVTSRDTTVSGTMSEAGIPPSRIRKSIITVRTNPIRVQSPAGGTSGPMSQETDWETISKRAGVPAEELRRKETTTTTKRQRRVSEFDWKLLYKAVILNGPTDIALTFVDYVAHSNQDARRFDQLTDETIRFVQDIENMAGCPVSLITTRFHRRSIIDRRNW